MTDATFPPLGQTPGAAGEAAAKLPPRLSDDPAKMIRIGAGVAGLFFVGFLGWAAVAPLDAGAYAHGVIAVAGNRQAVQSREGGVVTAIRVVEGQSVVKGQILVELSASDLRASERGMTGEVLTLLAQRARLVAERDGRPGFAAPPEFADLAPEDKPLAEDSLRLQRQQFQARRGSLQTQRGVLNQRILQLGQQTSGAQRQLDANREQQKLIAEELDGVQELAAKGFAPKTRVLALQRSAASLTGEDGAYRAQIARNSEAEGETRLQALSLDRQMLEEVSGQLRDVQVRLDDLQPKVLAAREQLARATVRAPSGGKVVGLNVFTVGGVVAPGQTLMEIVPQDRRLVIQAKVSPNDADDLKPGQKTQIRFTSLHERDLPLLNGTLTELSADSFTDEKSGVQYFKAEVAAPPEELEKIRKVRGGQSGLQAGLPVEVLIPLRKRSALAYLMEPLFQTFWRMGREH
ncbi:HlyD family type I secretion periplasmic adaptor subunit [Caulobacter soli]|uniref:HlyD family type I secretion periplasmic adaptor subunit n=1 Tax=Caulobacter soli TaxID=2708539 RepID=UPI0013ECD41C|nr:HlyD family type I secretion periplasmic adaptor subunit [Caulobacter soli]